MSTADQETVLALPDSEDELIRHYTFSTTDLALIRQRRGDANRLGFAVQLCLLRYPGQALSHERLYRRLIRPTTADHRRPEVF